jgi:flagellar biosynthesis protein FlhB
MAESESGAERTEQPTPQRREKARKEGQVPFSQEAGIAAGLAMFALSLVWILPRSARMGVRYFEDAWLHDLDAPLSASSAADVVEGAAWFLLGAVGPVGALAGVATLLVGLSQVGFQFRLESFGFKGNRLDPRKWFKRLASAEFPVSLGKSLLKGLGVVALSVWSLRDAPERLRLLPFGTVGASAAELQHLAVTVVWRVAGAMVVVALLDVLWTRYRFEEKLKMTKQEVKDDLKDSDGNPHVKAAMRRRAQERAKNRLADQIAEATVVAVNPTHYAVALRYRRGTDASPVVVAKGVDFRAARIRELAQRFDVPIIEDKPLARALHALVAEGNAVPIELYKPVAKLLAIVYRRRPEEWKS